MYLELGNASGKKNVSFDFFYHFSEYCFAIFLEQQKKYYALSVALPPCKCLDEKNSRN